MSRPGLLACTALTAVVVLYLVVGDLDLGPTGLYQVTATAALAVAWWGLTRSAPHRPGPWRWILAGFTAWVLGDLVWEVENGVLDLGLFPAWSDLLYLAGYCSLVVGVLLMVRTRRAGRDRTAVLDAAVVAAGVGVPTWVFLVAPAAVESGLSLAGKLVSTAYPLLDLFLVVVLARLLVTPGARTPSFRLLLWSLLVTLVADAAWNAGVVMGGTNFASRWLDAGWLAGYVLVAAAVTHRSMHEVTEPPPRRTAATGSRLVALAVASTLPAATLAVDGLGGGEVAWQAVAVGSVVLSLLVLARMAGLLEQVQVQAVQLSALARVDPLTGVPNRRTWDHELSRACAAAREGGEPLAVALLDLDRFKRFNDRHGHQAGDRLLREAASGWTEALRGSGAMLARYGGEEFAVLLPGHGSEQAVAVLDRLRAVTPGEQTFSAGVAVWDPTTDPATAVGEADTALYEAKRRGRDRVVPAGGVDDGAVLPGWALTARVVMQPIVAAADGHLVGHEALARFTHDGDVPRVLARAHEEGFGDVLEAHLVSRAMAVPGRPVGTTLFVNVSPAALESPRFWQELPDDLAGVVVELVEEQTLGGWDAQAAAGRGLRSRGADLAVDDLGAGRGDLGRMLAVRPDIVKIDRGVVGGCASDPVRLRLVEMVVGLARAAGASVCAEGVETEADLQALRGCGVDLVQGFHVGRPAEGWSGARSAEASPVA